MQIQSGLKFTFGQFSLGENISIFAFFDEFSSVGLWGSRGGIWPNLESFRGGFGGALGRLWGSFGEALGKLWGSFVQARAARPTDYIT